VAAPAGSGTATLCQARPSQCSASGWLFARACEAPTAHACVALDADTPSNVTSFSPDAPGSGGLGVTRHGLDTGPDPAVPAAADVAPSAMDCRLPAATAVAPDSPVTVTTEGPATVAALPS
jgi:hypothetical protein